MADGIRDYLGQKKGALKKLDYDPLILLWLKSPGMRSTINIIDEVVVYLSSRNGGGSKLKEWFLSGDQAFSSILVERYIIKYLQNCNDNLVDNIKPPGVDASIKINGESIGIEITTINSMVGEHIFMERLKEKVERTKILSKYTIDIDYQFERIRQSEKDGTLDSYIDSVGNAIIKKDKKGFQELGVSVEYRKENPGYVVYHPIYENDIRWYKKITEELSQKLMGKPKQRQFRQRKDNIVFVGVNFASSSDGIFPRMFEHFHDLPAWCAKEILELRRFWQVELIQIPHVVGICFYFISVDREYPYYPLEIFWQEDYDDLTINLCVTS